MKQKAAVIGAGIAGVSAAVELADNSYKVDVFETRNFAGGRLFSFADKTTGDILDNGQHLMMGAYKETLKLFKKLSAEEYLTEMKKFHLPIYDEKGSVHLLKTRCSIKYIDMLDALIHFNINISSRIALLRFFYNYFLHPAKFKDISVHELLTKTNQSEELVKNFWEPLTLAVTNQSINNAPAALLKTVLDRAFFADSDSKKFIFCNSGLSDLFKNFESYLSKNSSQIYYSHNVRSIEKTGHLFTLQTNKGDYKDYDIVISALPPHVLNKIAVNSKMQIIADNCCKFRYSTIVSLYLWTDKEISPDIMSGMTGTQFQWLFNKRKMQKNTNADLSRFQFHYTLTASSVDELANLSDKEILEICIMDIKTSFSIDISSSILHHFIIKDRFATILQTPETENAKPSQESGIDGFFLAGDWIKTGLPATIESAVLSGKIKTFLA